MRRQQRALFAPTLDSMIGSDDPVRLVDEILAGLDWTAWEAEYDGARGQPPIHPRIIAAAILYGLCRGIRSTRKLQAACCYRVDFLWLVEGRQIDYTTFAKFRTRFGPQLKDLFRQLGRLAMSLGLVRLGEVAFDGTRVKSNNSRYNTRTAATLAEKLAALDAQFDQMLSEWDAIEAQVRGIEFFAPAESNQPQPDNPARRDDATQPVLEAQWSALPRNPQGQLDRSCFVYQAEQDCYYCPLGQVLPFAETKPDVQQGQRVERRIYRCQACAGCPLAGQCVSPARPHDYTRRIRGCPRADRRTHEHSRRPADL
jgi:transposase